jgi:hypothetical protein
LDYELEINIGGGGTGINQFRLRKTSSALVEALTITIEQIGTDDIFTASTATSSVTAPTIYY